MTQPRASRFRDHFPTLTLSEAELEAELQARIISARETWPHLPTSDRDFAEFLAQRVGPSGLPMLAHAAELLLVCACIQGVPRALAAFHKDYAPVVSRVLQRRAAARHGSLEDVEQEVFSKLLVAANGGARPKLADYRGLGPLRSWVATVTVTTLLMTLRGQERRREQPLWEEDPIVDPIVRSDPELHFLKSRYREVVANAIVCALAQLADRERVLLRLHLVQRLSIDKLATMYSINRATAARWLVSARHALLEGTRRELQQQLRVSDRECDSILNLVRSQLEVSIARYLVD